MSIQTRSNITNTREGSVFHNLDNLIKNINETEKGKSIESLALIIMINGNKFDHNWVKAECLQPLRSYFISGQKKSSTNPNNKALIEILTGDHITMEAIDLAKHIFSANEVEKDFDMSEICICKLTSAKIKLFIPRYR